ncbi:MAG: hypothetical protein AAGG59_03690 [Bacteroidota bacterium]
MKELIPELSLLGTPCVSWGFDRGYELSETMPEAFKHIAIIDKSNSERLQDFEDGRKQHESDHSIDLEKEKFRQKLKEHARTKGRDRNRGHRLIC